MLVLYGAWGSSGVSGSGVGWSLDSVVLQSEWGLRGGFDFGVLVIQGCYGLLNSEPTAGPKTQNPKP